MPINNINKPKKNNCIKMIVVNPGSVMLPKIYSTKYKINKIILNKNVDTPIKKINISGVFVKDVIADSDISKYFEIDIFEKPENLSFLLYLTPVCLNPIKEIKPLKYKFLSSNCFK